MIVALKNDRLIPFTAYALLGSIEMFYELIAAALVINMMHKIMREMNLGNRMNLSHFK